MTFHIQANKNTEEYDTETQKKSFTQPQQEVLTYFTEHRDQILFKFSYSKDGSIPTDLAAISFLILQHELNTLYSSFHNFFFKNETNYVSTLPYSESYTFAQNTLKPKSQQFAALVLFESTCAGGISDKGINQYTFYCLTRK